MFELFPLDEFLINSSSSASCSSPVTYGDSDYQRYDYAK